MSKGLGFHSEITLSFVESCSHGRALDYFTESIRNDNFFAYSCRNFDDMERCACDLEHFEKMGEHVSPDAEGVYYVETNGQEDFAQGPLEIQASCQQQEMHQEGKRN